MWCPSQIIWEDKMRMRSMSFGKKKVIMVIVIVAVIVLGIFASVFTFFNDHTYVAIVTNKERIAKNNGGDIDSYYLIFAKDNEGNCYEFKNEDTLLRGKFNSSTFYNQIEVGQTYQFTVVGFRIRLFSWYENIIKFEKVD